MPFCWFAPPPERCGCDVSCPLEALFSACLVARATRGLMCAVCVFVYALESEIEQPGQLMEAFHFSAPTTTTTTQGCGLSLIDVGIGDRGRSKLSSDQVGNWTHDGENAQHCTRQTQTGPGLAPFQPSAAPRPGTRARRRLSSPVGRWPALWREAQSLTSSTSPSPSPSFPPNVLRPIPPIGSMPATPAATTGSSTSR